MSLSLDRGYNISAGEFKLVVDAIDKWPVVVKFTTTNGHALKIEVDNRAFEIAFSEMFDEKIVESLKPCSWKVDECLKTMASMIPRDTIFLENEKNDVDYQLDQLESFIGNIRASDNWKAKQDFWIKNREYRELKAKLEWIDARIPEVGVFIDDDNLEFYLSFDHNHDICVVNARRMDA